MTDLFLAGKVPFPAITATVAEIVKKHPTEPIDDLEHVLSADRAAREATLAAALGA